MTELKQQPITVRNAACLDLRTTSEETLRSIGRIENVAVLLYSPQNAESVAHLTTTNVASMLEVPADAQVITGQKVIRPGFVDELSEPMNAVVIGQVMVMPDVQADEVRNGIERLAITGQLLYPEQVAGVIQSKVSHISGQTIAYPGEARLTIGKLNLTRSYLESVEDGTTFVVIGTVSARTVLPNDLIDRKVRGMQVVGSLTCREENAALLLSRMDDSMGFAQTTVIPEGFEPVDGSLTLDEVLLEALPARRLYCRDLRIADEVTPEQLDGALDALHVSNLLVAPAALNTVLARKCNLLETDAVLYRGALWKFDDEHTLHPQRFDLLEGPVTIVITGELAIAPDVEPAVLAQRVDKVHNFGEISCTPAQMAALQGLAGKGHGEFIDNTAATESSAVLGNTAYLKL